MIALRVVLAVLLVATLLLASLPVASSVILGTIGTAWIVDGVAWARRRRT